MFLSLEGIDGAGKTSAAEAVVARLEAAGTPALLVRKGHVHTDHPQVAARLSAIGRGGWDPTLDSTVRGLGQTPWVLFTATYYAALATQLVEPALAAGRTVVVDGWFHKFALRAARVGHEPLSRVLASFAAVPRPEQIVLLDVPPDVAAARLGTFTENETGNGSVDRADAVDAFVEFQQDVRRRLHELAVRERWAVVDGTCGPSETVASRVVDVLHDGGVPGRVPT